MITPKQEWKKENELKSEWEGFKKQTVIEKESKSSS